MDTQHSERNHSESFLIAHKVRGEPAFDVAVRFKCPICEPIRQGLDPAERGSVHCNECDEGQHWWIVPTSGHRAYPYWWIALKELPDLELLFLHAAPLDPRHTMPAGLRDHYETTAAPGKGKVGDLFSKLGFQRSAAPQVTRRI